MYDGLSQHALFSHKFTGKERDAESGLDNFKARYMGSSMGRFMSPDPIHIMNQKFVDPQQWNLYAYVRNNPLNLIDPTGLYLVICASGDKKCFKAADEFEKQRQKDLNSKNKQVRDAAATWGNRGKDNGVNVTFKSQQQVERDVQAKDASGFVNVKRDADGQVRINAEFSESLKGRDLARTIAHEGSHIEDDVQFLTSFNFSTDKYNSTFNFFHYDTEFRAFQVGAEIESYTNLACGGRTCSIVPGPKGYADLDRYLTTNPFYSSTNNDLVFDPNTYPQQ